MMRLVIAKGVLIASILALSSTTSGTRSMAPPAFAAKPASTGVYGPLDPAKARSLYLQAVARLLGQKRFELNEILHFGVRSQPEYYHLRLRAIAPNRLMQERNDRPKVTVQVGEVMCSGPRRWHCRHMALPGLPATVQPYLLPQLTHLTFTARETPATIIITIHAHGDPWQCPPIAVTCPIPGFDEKSFQERSRYAATLIVDRPSGLPGSLTSTVTMGFDRRHLTDAFRRNLVSPAQRISFNYDNAFSVDLPRYPKWKCPWWDQPGTWCMKEPGA
jgi:hypothetical protein